MIQQGEIYDYSDPSIPPHPVVVLSREELNRGDRVVAAIITSKKFAARSKLANCVVLKAGQFGMTTRTEDVRGAWQPRLRGPNERLVGGQLQFEPSPDVPVQGNVLVIGNQRIVVRVS